MSPIINVWRAAEPWIIIALSLITFVVALIGVSRWRWRMRYSGSLIVFKVEMGLSSTDAPLRSEQLFDSLHGMRLPWYKRIFRGQPHIIFIFINCEGRKSLYVLVPNFYGFPTRISGAIADKLTGCNVQEVDSAPLDRFGLGKFGRIRQAYHSAFGLRTLKGFENDDPAEHIWNTLDLGTREGYAAVVILLKPCGTHWTRRGFQIREHIRSTDDPDPRRAARSTGLRGIIQTVIAEFFSLFKPDSGSQNGQIQDRDKRGELSELSKDVTKTMDAKLSSRAPYRVVITVVVCAENSSRDDIERIASAFKQLDKHNVLRYRHTYWPISRVVAALVQRNLWPLLGSQDIVSPEELAGIIHNPFGNTTVARLDFNRSRTLPPPHDLTTGGPGNIELGYNDFRGRAESVSIPLDDFRLHVAVIGVTGSGKSTLIKAIVSQWVRHE